MKSYNSILFLDLYHLYFTDISTHLFLWSAKIFLFSSPSTCSSSFWSTKSLICEIASSLSSTTCFCLVKNTYESKIEKNKFKWEIDCPTQVFANFAHLLRIYKILLGSAYIRKYILEHLWINNNNSKELNIVSSSLKFLSSMLLCWKAGYRNFRFQCNLIF